MRRLSVPGPGASNADGAPRTFGAGARSYRRLRKRSRATAWRGSGAGRGRWPRGCGDRACSTVSASAPTGCVVLESKERELVFRPVREYVRTPADLGYRYEDLWIEVAGERRRRERARPRLVAAGRKRGGARHPLPARHPLEPRQQPVPHRALARARLLGARHRLPRLRPQRRRAAERGADLRRCARGMGGARAPRAAPPTAGSSTATRSGAAVAIDLAAGSDGAAGVIAEAGFTSLADVVAESSTALSLLVTQSFDALSKAKALKVPALFLHGTPDRLVPPAMSERLYEAAPLAQAPALDRRRRPRQLERHRDGRLPPRGPRVRRRRTHARGRHRHRRRALGPVDPMDACAQPAPAA